MGTQILIEAGEGGADAEQFVSELANAMGRASGVTPEFINGTARLTGNRL